MTDGSEVVFEFDELDIVFEFDELDIVERPGWSVVAASRSHAIGPDTHERAAAAGLSGDCAERYRRSLAVDDLVKAMGIEGISRSEVSRLAAQLDAKVAEFRVTGNRARWAESTSESPTAPTSVDWSAGA